MPAATAINTWSSPPMEESSAAPLVMVLTVPVAHSCALMCTHTIVRSIVEYACKRVCCVDYILFVLFFEICDRYIALPGQCSLL